MGITIQEHIDNLNRSVQDFKKFIESLPEALFFQKMNGWAPRDITAHLIGWNINTIKGCQQLINGELPFYFNDPGDDYCKINALMVQEYNTKDKRKLFSQLDDSLKKLKHFLISVDPIAWETDFGIKYKGYTITIKNTVETLIHDYISHRQQIEKWAGVK